MVQKKYQSSLLILSALLLVLYVTSIKLIELINTKKDKYQNISEKFETNVKDSLKNLDLKLKVLAREISRQRNKEILELNEAKRIFRSSLVLGSLDSVRIYTKKCKVKASYTLYEKTLFSCEAPVKEGFEWFTYKGNSLVTLNRKVTINHKIYYLQGQVHLNKTWLKSRKELYENLKTLKLSMSSKLVSPKTHEEIYRGRFEGSDNRASLWTDDLFYSYFNYFFEDTIKLSSNSLDFLVILILFFLVFLFIKGKVSYRQENKIISDFDNWHQKTLKSDYKDIYNQCLNHLEKNKKDSLYNFIQKSAENIRKVLDDTIKNQAKNRENYQTLKELELKNSKLEESSKKEKELKSLTQQIKEISPPLLKNIESIFSDLDEALYILENSASKNCDIILSHLSEWKSQGSIQGFRKYMRSLNETQGNSNEKSLLEEEILFFIKNLSQTSGQLDYCTKSLSQVLSAKKRILDPLETWSSFVKEEKDFKEISLLGVLEQAKQLYYGQNPEVKEKINLEIDPKLRIFSARSSVKLVSSFYHILSFCHENKSSPSLLIKTKQHENKNLLLLTCEGNEIKEDLEKSKSLSLLCSEILFKDFMMSQDILGLDANSFLISLEWEEKNLSKNSEIFQEKREGGALSLDH